MKKLLYTSLAIIVTIILDTAYFAYSIQDIGRYRRDSMSEADAIILFAPRKHTIAASFGLSQKGYAPLILVTTEKPKKYYLQFFHNNHFAAEQFIFSSDIGLNTKDLANTVTKMVVRYDISSAYLVTDYAQIDRALLELSKLLPQDIELIPYPVINKNNNMLAVIKEYFKYRTEYILSIFGADNLVVFNYDK